jgi:hypothetical protein
LLFFWGVLCYAVVMDTLHVELIQLVLIAGYVLTTVRKEKWWSTLGCAWWCWVLFVDVFIWRGNRPPYAKEFLNCFDTGIGLVILYAKFKNPLRHVLTSLVVVLSGVR